MCGHGEERMMKVWILNRKGKKTPASLLVNVYEPEINTVYQFQTYMNRKLYKKTKSNI